jgi:hypothetical protein
MLDGAVPYVDYVDVNQPLMTYLAIPPVVLAGMFHISPIPVFTGFVILLVAVSGFELSVLLKNASFRLSEPGRVLLVFTWIASYFVVDWNSDVGQREYMFMLFYMPFLFLRVLRYREGIVNNGFAFILGIQAGIGAALKPSLLLVAVNVELLMLFTSSIQRVFAKIEIYAFLSALGAVIIHWLIVPAAMREAFFDRWLPLVNFGYTAYDTTYGKLLLDVLRSPVSLAAIAAMLTAIFIALRGRSSYQPFFVALASLVGMSILYCVLQKKGWTSDRVPINMAGLLCLAMLVVEGRNRWTTDSRNRIGPVAWLIFTLLIGGVIGTWWFVRATTLATSQDVATLRPIIEKHSKPHDRVLVISSAPQPAYPMLLQMDRRPGSRYFYAFPVVCYYAKSWPSTPDAPLYRPRDQMPVEEHQFLDDLVYDCEHRKPELILIENDSKAIGLPRGFRLFNYFRYNGSSSKILDGYEELPGSDDWKVFKRTADVDL